MLPSLGKDVNIVYIVMAVRLPFLFAITKLPQFTHFLVKLGNEKSYSGNISGIFHVCLLSAISIYNFKTKLEILYLIFLLNGPIVPIQSLSCNVHMGGFTQGGN